MNIDTKSPMLELICEICQKDFNTKRNVPKMLQCGHTICLECVIKIQQKKIEKCPFDKKTINMEEDKLVNNFYILSLIETGERYLIDNNTHQIERINLTPKAVVNSPGWKNTVDGFILDTNILISAETNGFIYCTDLYTSEWWFMYLNQFCAKFLFMVKNNMYCIDFNGNLYQIFLKNYYVQIGRKGCWKNTTHLCVVQNKLFTIENNSKIYETNVETGKWKEVFNLDINPLKDLQTNLKKNNENLINNGNSNQRNSQGSRGNNNNSHNSHNSSFNENFELDGSDGELNEPSRNIKAIFSNGKSMFLINKAYELYEFDPVKYTKTFKNITISKKIDLYCVNSTHIFFIEYYGKTIYRARLREDVDSIIEALEKEGIEENLKKCSTFPDFYDSNKPLIDVEFFYDLGETLPNRIICNDQKLVVIDKQGSLLTIDLLKSSAKHSDCRFMIRNCHISNLAILGDGNLLILDPIRLSLNKLNILNGSEIIILHSQKFLNTIKYLFTNGVSKVYLIDVNGNLFYFNEAEKKLVQIGNTNICKNLQKFTMFKNFLLVQLEEDTLLKINLNDGNYNDMKVGLINQSDYFFGDNINFIIINCKGNEVSITDPCDEFTVKKVINHDFTHISTMTLFKNYLVMYNKKTKNIEGINIDDSSFSILVKDFPEVFSFINNFECLACILKDGIIYTLYY